MQIPTRSRRAALAALALTLTLAGCDETVGGNQPIGGDEATEASLQRFVRRTHLDLAGAPPSDAVLAADVATLRGATNPPAARRALVQRLMTEPAWATVGIEELANASAMITGGLNGGPAGLLFQRLGGTYPQLLDIVWQSEVYREAIVRAVFERYLARRPSATERAHFVALVAPAAPDARLLIEDVMTSKEYFEP